MGSCSFVAGSFADGAEKRIGREDRGRQKERFQGRENKWPRAAPSDEAKHRCNGKPGLPKRERMEP